MAKFLSWDRLKEYDGLIKTYVGNLYNELISKINGKANSSHTHSISNVENLESSLASKSDSNHVHNYAGSTSNGGAANSAIKLATARAINGVDFNGTSNITITANPTETALTGVNLNTITTPGFYYGGGGNGCTNVPPDYGIDAFGMIVFKTANGYTSQMLIGGNNSQNFTFIRTSNDTSWSDWSRYATYYELNSVYSDIENSLTNKAPKSHKHAASEITSGTLGVARGGTGATTFTSGAALIGAGTGAVTTRAITNNTAVTYITYNTNLMTTNTLAYWNGAYSSSNASNLAYCAKGAFGTIVTKGTGDYLPIGGGTLNGALTVLGRINSGNTSTNGGIDIYHDTPYLDFHCGKSSSDYTTRIIEKESGKLTIQASNVITSGNLYTGATTDDTYHTIYARNKYASGGIHVSTASNVGLMNAGISTWIIRMPSDGVCRIAEKFVIADNFHTEKNNQMTLGAPSYKWKQLYAATATINTSDRNDKKDFRMFDSNENYEKFFMDLKPMVFKFKNGESGRDHFGFVSQDVEESLYKYGFDDKSFAGFCKDAIIEEIEGEDGITREVPKLDEDGNEQYVYGLRYSEFTAMNTYMIQKIVKENEELKEENKAFKAEIEEIKKALAELKG